MTRNVLLHPAIRKWDGKTRKQELAAEAPVALGSIGLGLIAAYRDAIAIDKICENEKVLEDLTPVTKSWHCKAALEFVAGGEPAVLAWRDLAIAERGVLCALDVQIMRELHYFAKAAAEAAATQLENERACRQLYGIPDHADLRAEPVRA